MSLTREYYYELTSGMCPEQYDVFNKDGEQVGYIRLRWGHLRCDVPDCGGETIYEHHFSNGLKGSFDNERERNKYLNIIDDRLKRYYKNKEEKETK